MTRRYPTENANSTEVEKPWVDDVFPLHPLCRKDFIKIVKAISHVRLFATPWTAVACQASLSMEFSRQEYWSE